jgi:signal transduction histidine kinase
MENKSPAKLEWRGLTSQILLFFVLPLSGALILVSFWSISLHRQGMRMLVGERDERTVRSAADALSEQLDHRRFAIRWLAYTVEAGDSLSDILTESTYLIPQFDYGMAFITGEGRVLASTGDSQIWFGDPHQFAGLVKDYLKLPSGEVLVSTAVILPSAKDFLAYTFFQESPNEPIAVGAFSITGLARDTFGEEDRYQGSISILLTDALGNPLFFSGIAPLESPPLEHPGVAEALRGENGTRYVNVGSTEHVVAYIPVPASQWVLILEEPWDSVTSPMLRYTELGPLILIPVLVFALASLWLSASHIIQPLKKLEALAIEIEWGNISEAEENIKGIQEIQSLHRSLVHLGKRVKRSQQNLKDYIGSITEAQEEERRRLARELHDESLQSLIALNQRLQMLQRRTRDENLADAIAELEDMVSGTMEELRRFTRALRPIYLEDLGLVAALKMLVHESSDQANTEFHITITGPEKRLTDDVEIAIFRIVQEAINNILRHARARLAEIDLAFGDDHIHLTIRDDGIGFEVPASPSDLAPLNHFGLLGIFERADLIGAKCEISSQPGKGTILSVLIPNK